MKIVQNEKEVYHSITLVKRDTDQYLTNFYFAGFKLNELIDSCQLFMIYSDKNIFFIRINDGFYNLYFCSRNKNFLGKSLEEDLLNIKSPIVTDLVGEEKKIEELKDIFIKKGFNHYTTFIRMSKMGSNIDIKHNIADIFFAIPEDVIEVYNIISRNFNKYSEHLPSQEEIVDATSKHNILIKKEKSKIIALLFFDKVGYSSTLRYWYVDKYFRGKKLGAALIERYFDECKEIKKFILWVEKLNDKAISIYKYYGYNYDNKTDLIMIKGGGVDERYSKNIGRDKA